MQAALLPAAPPLLYLRLSFVRRTRRPFTMQDYRYIMENYTNGWFRAHQVATHLGRPYDSVRVFINRHPELQKHPRTRPETS